MKILKLGFRRVDRLAGRFKGEQNRPDLIGFQHGALEVLHLVCRHGNIGNGQFAESVQGQNTLHGIIEVKRVVAAGMEHLLFIFFIRGSAELAVLLESGKRTEELPDLFAGNLHAKLSCNRQARGDLERGLLSRLAEHSHIRLHVVLHRHHQGDILHGLHQFRTRDILIECLSHNRVRRHRIGTEQNVPARARSEKPDERNNNDCGEQTKQDTAVLHKHIVHFGDDHVCSFFDVDILFFSLKIERYRII